MNTIENIIISAVNEYEGAYNVKDLDEATDILIMKKSQNFVFPT